MPNHLSDRGVETKSSSLNGKRLGFAICGGIGAVEVVKLIRELRRHGASVAPFATPSMSRFITPLSVEWAAGEKLLTEAQAEVDHLEEFDLVIVAPATLNTVNKAALGLADNAVTLLVASQLGRKAPVLFCPTMNQQLRGHPAFAGARAQLEKWGAHFLEAKVEEDRLKMPAPEVLAEAAIKLIGER